MISLQRKIRFVCAPDFLAGVVLGLKLSALGRVRYTSLERQAQIARCAPVLVFSRSASGSSVMPAVRAVPVRRGCAFGRGLGGGAEVCDQHDQGGGNDSECQYGIKQRQRAPKNSFPSAGQPPCQPARRHSSPGSQVTAESSHFQAEVAVGTFHSIGVGGQEGR